MQSLTIKNDGGNSMDVLQRKLDGLRGEAIPTIDPTRRMDLTTSASHPRVSFPFPDITPYAQALDRETLAQRLGVDSQALGGNITNFMDVSSSPDGVCQVTAGIYVVTNSHAGSHGDQPSHWLANPPFESFDNRQYNGTAVVLDITNYLRGNKAITPEIIQEHAELVGTDLRTLHRLFVRTYEQTPSEWQDEFAYLSPEAGAFLGKLPNLVLFATDAPSVDHPNAAPIHTHAHGGLWAGRVAILEGYESNSLPKQDKLEGVVQTTLLETSGVKDAKYAVITFYPVD